MECGDGLDHGVDASMPASSALTITETKSSILSSSLNLGILVLGILVFEQFPAGGCWFSET
jgi:hypothetical protein